MTLTTDRNDPRIARGQTNETGQHDAYLVLSEEERAKGFVRPVRRSYLHVGKQPVHPLRDLTADEHARYDQYGYVSFEAYPENPESAVTGRYWTKAQLASGCQSVTTMALPLAETYARDPSFYGATYCCGCCRHFPVDEFVWDGTTQAVGS